MFCCFLPPRTPKVKTQIDEKKYLLTSGTTAVNYQTLISIPYAHVLRDDKIQIESSDVVETNPPEAYLLFNGTISDKEFDTPCFAFDDANVSTPVVIATRTPNAHILFEHLYKIEHVTAINPSKGMQMHQINRTKTISSTTVSMARPFDEFPVNSTTSNDPPEVPNNNIIPKPD